MSKTLYLHGNTAIINFNQGYPSRNVDILNSKSFENLIDAFLNSGSDYVLEQLTKINNTADTLTQFVLSFLREVHVTPLERVRHPLINNLDLSKEIVESLYTYWRNFQRCSVVYLGKKSKSELVDFITKDNDFNHSILTFYRNFQEKLQGRKNKIYRQLKAGTNASITLREKTTRLPEAYSNLKHLVTIDSVLLHSPLLLHPKTNKREGHFEEVFSNPLQGMHFDSEIFFSFPAKVGNALALIYIHRDFIFSGLSLSNLFELATTEDLESTKPDIIIAFGVEDGTQDMVFYNDRQNEVVVAKIAHNPKIEYFGYLKKITLTAFNVAVMNRGWLPIHGSMINVHLKNGSQSGIVFMGDSGAGKSEIIEEITSIGGKHIDRIDIIFDDMGAFHLIDGRVHAQGTEIGAFVRLDDLDRSLPYQAMDRSIFMNPESSNNARVIIPVSSYKTISQSHKVDYFFYANNYESKAGLTLFNTPSKHKHIFVDGKRMSKATTHEVGLTTSYFANPFGPLQLQDVCNPIIDTFFDVFDHTGVVVGEVYTNLGVDTSDSNRLKDAAQAVLDVITMRNGGANEEES